MAGPSPSPPPASQTLAPLDLTEPDMEPSQQNRNVTRRETQPEHHKEDGIGEVGAGRQKFKGQDTSTLNHLLVTPQLLAPGFLNHNTVDIWDQKILSCGAVMGSVGY